MAVVPSSMTRFRLKLRAFDLFAAAIAPATAMMIRDPGYIDRIDLGVLVLYSAAATVASVIALAYFNIGQTLSRFLSTRDIVRVAKAAAASVAMTIVIMFSATALDSIPRSMPALHFAALLAFWAGPRIVRAHWLSNAKARPSRLPVEGIILAGANSMSALYLQLLGAAPAQSSRVLALLDDDRRLHGRSIGGHMVMGPLASAGALVKEFAVHGVRVDRIVVAIPDRREEVKAIDQLRRSLGREFQVEGLGDMMGVASGPAVPACEAFEVARVQLSGPYWRLRRLLDVIGASAALVLLSPVLLVGVLLTWINVGSPVIFWQERAGRRRKRIRVHKFRTLGPPLAADGRVLSDDERLSAVGRFMRSFRIDELPQLFDVVGGHMALVGPRPLLPADLPSDPTLRQSVRPGLTGWAQVHGGKALTAEDKAALDEWYICHASVWLDLRILWLTIAFVASKRDVRHSARIDEAIAFRGRLFVCTGRAREETARVAA